MEAERPGDANMPPDDDQDSTGDHAAHPGNAEPETRGREEYYSELRVEVSREESAAARQVIAEEQAAAEKWQVKVAESRWMWSEYQSKWPPAERSSPDKPTASPGSWHGDGNRVLEAPENSRVEAECDRIARREEDRISPAMRSIESQDPDRHLTGFDHRLKGRDRIKEKVYDRIKLLKNPPEEAVSRVSDTVRYTFQYRESRYTQGVWTDIERLKDEGFELQKLKNYWADDQYRGINSTWIEPDTRQRFEVQFHTRISFEAKQLTHTSYERIRSKQADAFEELVLEAFQRKVAADVRVPPGADDIPDYRKEG
jgi:hypothetical protein